MTIDHELIDMLRTEMRSGVSDLRVEMKAGFNLLADGIGQTNARLDQTNARLDQTNARLDQTNVKLDKAIVKLDDVALKVNGISSFLIASEQNVHLLQNRIIKLEDRMDRYDERHNSA